MRTTSVTVIQRVDILQQFRYGASEDKYLHSDIRSQICVNDESQEMYAAFFMCRRKCATGWAGVLEQIFWCKIQVAACTKHERNKNSAFPVCVKFV